MATWRVRILFYSGRGFGSQLIRWQTRSQYSHAAFQFGNVIIEAIQGQGVIRRIADERDFDAVRFHIDLDAERYGKLWKWACDHVGNRYDWLGIARFLSRRRWYRNDTWFCSEFVYAGLETVGYPLLANTEPWEVSPGLLVKSPLLIPESTT